MFFLSLGFVSKSTQNIKSQHQDTNILYYVVIFKVGVKMDVIFVDFSKEKTLKLPTYWLNG